MRTYEEVTQPAKTYTQLKSVNCDLCGRETREVGDRYDNKIEETTVEMKVGESWPEGSNYTQTSFDICVRCFAEKLVPWFKEQGAAPRTEDCYY